MFGLEKKNNSSHKTVKYTLYWQLQFNVSTANAIWEGHIAYLIAAISICSKNGLFCVICIKSTHFI